MVFSLDKLNNTVTNYLENNNIQFKFELRKFNSDSFVVYSIEDATYISSPFNNTSFNFNEVVNCIRDHVKYIKKYQAETNNVKQLSLF